MKNLFAAALLAALALPAAAQSTLPAQPAHTREEALEALLKAVTLCPVAQNPAHALRMAGGNVFGNPVLVSVSDEEFQLTVDLVKSARAENRMVRGVRDINLGSLKVVVTYAPGGSLSCSVAR